MGHSYSKISKLTNEHLSGLSQIDGDVVAHQYIARVSLTASASVEAFAQRETSTTSTFLVVQFEDVVISYDASKDGRRIT